MGRGGDFNIRYKVWTEQLAAQLRQGEEMVRASSQRMTAASMPTVGRTLNQEEIASQQVLNQSLQATTGARKAVTAEKKEQRQAQAQANRETERAARALKRQGAAMSDSQKLVRHFTLALRRMVLWWTTAAVLLGAQKLTKEIVTVAAAFQLVVKELTVLGNEGEQAYRRLAASAIDTAVQTGRSFEEAADALKGWVRQGYSAIEAADLMRTTLVGLNLTQLASTELVRTMTAIMRAFNIEASSSISIIDKLVGVSRRYAIETGQLATGIRRFAASANVANVTLDQQIGVMTAMMVRTQQSAQMVGRAGRTIFTRMRRNAVEALETIAKVRVFTDETRQSYRSLWEILTDLAATWKILTEAEKEEIAFQSAGLRQREFFLALMSDFNIAQEANIDSLASVGLAYKSNILIVNTFSKSVAGLKTAWTGLLSQQTGILGFVQGLVDALRSLLEVSRQIPEALITIGTFLPALIALGAALFTAWSPPLMLTILAITSALVGLTSVLGKLRGADMDEVIQQGKEMNDIMLLEAQATEKLATEFISLKDAQDKSGEESKALLDARDALLKLNPDLYDSEDDLNTIYDKVKDQLDVMAEKTKALTAEKRKLLEQTLLLGHAEAVNLRTELEGAVVKITQQRGVTDQYGVVNPFELTQVQKLAQAIRQDWMKAIADLTKLKTTMYDTDVVNLRENAAFVDKLREAYESAVPAIERHARMAALATKDWLSLNDPWDAQAREDTALLDYYTKQADLLSKNYVAIQRYVGALEAVEEAEKKLAAFYTPTEEAKDPVGKGKVIPASAAYVKTLKEGYQWEVKFTSLRETRIELEKNLNDTSVNTAEIARRVYDRGIAYLATQKELARTEGERLAVAELLDEHTKRGLAPLELHLDLIKAQIKLNNENQRIIDKAVTDSQRAYDAEVQAVVRMMDADNAMTNQAIDNQIKLRAEQIKTTDGDVAAAGFVRDAWYKVYLGRRKQQADLERDTTGQAMQPVVDEAREQTLEAEQKVIGTTITLLAEQARIRTQLGEESQRMLDLQRDAQLDILEMEKGTLAARQENVRQLQAAYDAVNKAGATDTERLQIAKALYDLQEAQIDLKKAEVDLALDLKRIEQERADAESAAAVERVRIQDGDLAALKAALLLADKRLADFDAGKEYESNVVDVSAGMTDLVAGFDEVLGFVSEATTLTEEWDEMLGFGGDDAREIADQIERSKLELLSLQATQAVINKLISDSVDLEKELGEIVKEIDAQESIRRFNKIAVWEGERAALRERITGASIEVPLLEQLVTEAEKELAVLMLVSAEEGNQIAILEAQYNLDVARVNLADARLQREKDITAEALKQQQAEQRAITQTIDAAFGAISGAMRGESIGQGLVTGLGGALATFLAGGNDVLLGILSGAVGIVGELFAGPADDLSDSLEHNTTAIDRNTQTLQDVFAQRIGVPTGFALPASIMMQGALPGGGSVTTVSNQIDIHVDGRGQDAEQIAVKVQKRLDKQFSINSRRGFGTNVYARG